MCVYIVYLTQRERENARDVVRVRVFTVQMHSYFIQKSRKSRKSRKVKKKVKNQIVIFFKKKKGRRFIKTHAHQKISSNSCEYSIVLKQGRCFGEVERDSERGRGTRGGCDDIDGNNFNAVVGRTTRMLPLLMMTLQRLRLWRQAEQPWHNCRCIVAAWWVRQAVQH